MTQDYAKRRKPKRNQRQRARAKKEPTPVWLWLLSGIILGLALAYGMAAVKKHGFAPLVQSFTALLNTETSVVEKMAAAPGKVITASPTFDFYNILAEQSVTTPRAAEEIEPLTVAQAAKPTIKEAETTQQLAKLPQPALSPPESGHYILQVGAFRKAADAEQLRAELALMGFSAKVVPFHSGSDTWNRVIVGPFESLELANNAQASLNAFNLQSLLRQV